MPNPAGLAVGNYRGAVVIIVNHTECASVNVNYSITPPLLALNPSTLTFSGPAGSPASIFGITVSGPNLSWEASANTVTGGNWLTIDRTSGTTPGTIPVGVNPSGLAAGSYQGSVVFTSPTAGNSPLTLPVTLTLLTPPTIALAPASVTLQAIQPASSATQKVRVGNSGSGTFLWNATVTTASGGSWLSVSPNSGTAGSEVSVAANAATLAVGNYTGAIQFVSPQAVNSPQTVTVSLSVIEPVTLALTPTSLAYQGTESGPDPEIQKVSVTETTGKPFSWNAAATTSSGGGWLTVTPSSGAGPAVLEVHARSTGLAAGSYSGAISITSPAALAGPTTVRVAMTVTVPEPRISLRPAHMLFASPPSPPAAQYLEISNTGTGMLPWVAGVTTQSGGDWLRVNPTSGLAPPGSPSRLMVTVETTGLPMGTYHLGTIQIGAGPPVPVDIPVTLALGVPAIGRGGIVNGATFESGAPIAIGSIASLFGLNLAGSVAAATSLPLPTILAGTQVLMGSTPLPLYYVSPTQINFQMPLGGPGSPSTGPLWVVRDGIRGPSEGFTQTSYAPGIFTVGGSRGAILNHDSRPNTIDNPAAPGSVIQIFATGLGNTRPPVPVGQPAPSQPLSYCDLVQRVYFPAQDLWSDGLSFCGLAPGFAGLYQVNVRLPENLNRGDSIPLQLGWPSGPPFSNRVTIAVR
jgi:uncharacterized protein (TIGR03437 family)